MEGHVDDKGGDSIIDKMMKTIYKRLSYEDSYYSAQELK